MWKPLTLFELSKDKWKRPQTGRVFLYPRCKKLMKERVLADKRIFVFKFDKISRIQVEGAGPKQRSPSMVGKQRTIYYRQFVPQSYFFSKIRKRRQTRRKETIDRSDWSWLRRKNKFKERDTSFTVTVDKRSISSNQPLTPNVIKKRQTEENSWAVESPSSLY